MNKLTSPIKFHGGKFVLAQWIISHFPQHIHYVEPYFGGGNVLLQKPDEWIEGHSEVVNDLDYGLSMFWRTLRSPGAFEDFKRIVEATPFSQTEFKKSGPIVHANNISLSLHEKAAAFFIRNRQSRQGLGKDFSTITRNRIRRGMNEQVSAWLTAIEGLPEIHDRLKRVVIFNDDALSVIKHQDDRQSLFYCDPTYLHKDEDGTSIRVTTSDYKHEMTLEDHVNLLDVLSMIKGKFILSGYPSKLYARYAKLCNWSYAEKEVKASSSSKKVKDKRMECLWMNFASEGKEI